MSMRAVIEELLKSPESAYSIAKGSGVTASVIQRLRLKEAKLDNTSFKNAEKLYQYALQKKDKNLL